MGVRNFLHAGRGLINIHEMPQRDSGCPLPSTAGLRLGAWGPRLNIARPSGLQPQPQSANRGVLAERCLRPSLLLFDAVAR